MRIFDCLLEDDRVLHISSVKINREKGGFWLLASEVIDGLLCIVRQ